MGRAIAILQLASLCAIIHAFTALHSLPSTARVEGLGFSQALASTGFSGGSGTTTHQAQGLQH